MLFKIEDESYEGYEAVERSKGNVSKAEDTIEAAQKEINVSVYMFPSISIEECIVPSF